MENLSKSPPSNKENLQRYHSLTSPLVPLATAQRQSQAKQEIRHNVSLRLDCIKNRNSKIYALNNSSFSELKAGAILYQVPQFSVPEVNYEVSDQIRKKIEDIRKEVITRLPDISKSSNYTPKKLEHQLSHRSAVIELEEWLRKRLQTPPTSTEDTIDYKNMIMGVGMKELIRLISKRCSQQGRIAQEIWELTWGICREIILNLSRRAKKCEDILDEELGTMRMTYQQEFQRLQQQNQDLKQKVKLLEEENKECMSELNRARQWKDMIEQKNKGLTVDNFNLQEQFRNILEENLAIYLQIGDKNKRGWIKKMYKNIASKSKDKHAHFQGLYQEQIVTTIDHRSRVEQITGEVIEPLTKEDIQHIGSQMIQELQKARQKDKKTSKKHKKPRKLRNPGEEQPSAGEDLSDSQTESNMPQTKTCRDLINNMKQEFRPVDMAVQTPKVTMTSSYAATAEIKYTEFSTNVSSDLLICFEEMGVNTQEVKDQMKQTKKKGKQNEKTREKSKILTPGAVSALSRQKSRNKGQKDKKSVLEIVLEQKKEKTEQIEKNPSQSKTQLSQSIRLSQQVSFSRQLVNSGKKQLNKVKSDDNRRSQPSKEKDNKEGRFTDKEHRQKVVSIFNQQESQPDISLNGEHRLSEPQRQQSSILNFYNKDSENISSNARDQSSVSTEKERKNQNSLKKQNLMNHSKYQGNNFDGVKDCPMIICPNCNNVIMERDQIIDFYSRQQWAQTHKNSKKGSQRNILNSASLKSLNKLPLCPIQSQDEREPRESVGKKGRKAPSSRRSSGYLHDIAFKKQMEVQLKSLFYRSEQHEDSREQEEEKQTKFCLKKQSPSKWLTSQLIQNNKDWINSIGYNQLQSSDGLEQYLQMVREINSMPEGKLSLTQKSAASTIEKNIFPILNQLLGSVRKAVKANKISEVMRQFTSLPSIVCNRISRKYGVKILAVKHLKAMLVAFKVASKFTEKYKTLELMMFTDCKSPHSQDLFVYLLLMGLYDPSYSGTRMITMEQVNTVRQVCEENLSRDSQVYGGEWWNKPEGETVSLNEMVRSVLTSYRLLKIARIQELGFLFLMLKRDHLLYFNDFVTFLTLFGLQYSLKAVITKKLLQFCDIRNRDQKVGISENMFAKFLAACSSLTLTTLEATLNDQITQNFSERQTFNRIEAKMFNKSSESKEQSPKSRDEQIYPTIGQIKQSNSAPQINQSEKPTLIDENQVTQVKKQNVCGYLRRYSSLSSQISKYLQNEEQTKFLTPRQRDFIKHYLIMHVWESQMDNLVGITDYFSNSMLGLVCTPIEEFFIKKPTISPS